jgi:hypothetical protein
MKLLADAGGKVGSIADAFRIYGDSALNRAIGKDRRE